MYFLTKSWAAVASALMFSASSAIAASGSETKLQTYAISGGQSVAIPVNAQGVLPASADGVQVEFAGPLLGPSEQSQKGVVMAWAFSLSVPSDSKYKSVKVENVSAPIATTLIAETNPKSEQ